MPKNDPSQAYLLWAACAVGGLVLALWAGAGVGALVGSVVALYLVVVFVNRLPKSTPPQSRKKDGR